MLSHHEFTQAFHAGIETKIAPPGTIGTAARFDVYRNNSLHSLTEALRTRFPTVNRLVGAEFFGMMAREFLRSHPPRSPVLLEWGGALPEFLTSFPPVTTLPYLPDVARIEIARGRAYHAADAQALTPQALQSLLPAMTDMRLTLMPAAQVLRLAQPGHTIWAMQQSGAPRVDIQWAPEQAFISRAGMAVITRAISPAEAQFFEALLAQETCFDAIGHAASVDTEFDPIPALSILFLHGQISAATPS